MNIYNSKEIDETIPVDEELTDLAEFFKIFGDKTRLHILFLLFSKPETGVNELSDVMSMHQTAISHQLKILRHMRLVTYRKEGRNVFYSLNDQHIHDILNIGMQHVQEAQK
ncbi:MAG: helix-turn-helix transcriptional regulator [Spirochaetales bacterium]|nr:helix-turn-helix transcriptional regulator [Spirochaetales bacterium]